MLKGWSQTLSMVNNNNAWASEFINVHATIMSSSTTLDMQSLESDEKWRHTTFHKKFRKGRQAITFMKLGKWRHAIN